MVLKQATKALSIFGYHKLNQVNSIFVGNNRESEDFGF